jgi:hypothetical protein
VVARAWAAQLRLCGRFRRLGVSKSSTNIVAAAIARGAGRVPVGRYDCLTDRLVLIGHRKEGHYRHDAPGAPPSQDRSPVYTNMPSGPTGDDPSLGFFTSEAGWPMTAAWAAVAAVS